MLDVLHRAKAMITTAEYTSLSTERESKLVYNSFPNHLRDSFFLAHEGIHILRLLDLTDNLEKTWQVCFEVHNCIA